jgi:hypothetical protein
LSANLVPTFVDRECHVVSVTNPYGRILGFLDRKLSVLNVTLNAPYLLMLFMKTYGLVVEDRLRGGDISTNFRVKVASTVKMEVVNYPEMWVCTYQTTRCRNPESSEMNAPSYYPPVMVLRNR